MADILVLGSVAEDQIISLRSPLKAGRHLEGKEGGRRLGGGAANTGGALALAGHHVMPVSPLGDDDTGRWLRTQLSAASLDLSQVHTLPGSSTRSIVLIDAAGERTIVNLTRANEPEPPNRILAADAHCLFVRSGAPDLTPLLRKKAETCLVIAHMPPCAENSRPARILLASESDLEPQALEAPFELGRRVAGGILEWVIVTRGPKGASAYSRDQTLSVPAPTVETVDTTGAGDAFAAGLIHALVTGAAMTRALETGCAWGAEATRWEASMLPAEAVERLTA